MKKVCVITGSRAEYGLLKPLINQIKDSKKIDLCLIATGMHLSSKFGNTLNEIKEDKIEIDFQIDMKISKDSKQDISKSISLGITSFTKAYDSLKPNLIIILGDRYEIFSAAIAAMISRIPIAHLHGGEATEGLIDESIRHSITKMSHLHFVAANDYKNRVIQLGEKPSRVFNVGAMGLDSIKKTKLSSKDKLEKTLNLKFREKNFLITFHPVTLEKESSNEQISQLLDALEKFKDALLIFTMPNSDLDGGVIHSSLKDFAKKNSNVKLYKSLGQHNYLSCLKYVDIVIGNSSSGLIEVPSFKKPTINIGDRQRGRLKANSVIDCQPTKRSISKAIKYAFSANFQSSLKNIENPYGKNGASKKICKVLEDTNLDNLLKKEFYNFKSK